MIYKIIAKAIAIQIKKVLLHIIDESQSGFVPRRLITDNAIVALFETFHWLQQRRSKENKIMAMKLDMSKAYDQLSGIF